MHFTVRIVQLPLYSSRVVDPDASPAVVRMGKSTKLVPDHTIYGFGCYVGLNAFRCRQPLAFKYSTHSVAPLFANSTPATERSESSLSLESARYE